LYGRDARVTITATSAPLPLYIGSGRPHDEPTLSLESATHHAGTEARRRCALIRDTLARDGLFHDAARPAEDGTALATRWRISPDPFLLTPEQVAVFRSLGERLLAFYRAVNRLYLESVRGSQPAWVHGYLDQGKPDWLVTYSRMNRFRDLLPAVIRPDVIPTDPDHDAVAANLIITELDSVPGGIGLTAALARAYAAFQDPGVELVGGPDGIVAGFAGMLRDQARHAPDPSGVTAIVVSEEARSYRPEMTWLAARLRERDLDVFCVEPRQVRFTEEALLVQSAAGERPVAVLYRFFELFDLMNVPKSELFMHGAKKETVVVTPPFKPALEEKLAFALLHHPLLTPFWSQELGEDTFLFLRGLMPRTWVLDPRPVPPHAVIPGLRLGGRSVADWRELSKASQKERRLVIKPSGFSELAWGSRGVSVGHDLPQRDWAAALESALAAFPSTPHVLQEFHKGRQYSLSYHDPAADEIVPMPARVRLSPYYFVTDRGAELAGVLATACSPEKKLIHGMQDAIMAPCAVSREG
jgi:hypothetical protein